MRMKLHVWRQKSRTDKGRMETYELDNINPDMSFLEMLDGLNEKLTIEGNEPVAFDHDCREGVCGMCSMVIDGVVRKGQPIRVLRENVVIYEGELESLRRFKDVVEEVRMGTECGIAVKNYNDVRPGDQIEVFERFEVARTLD